MPSTPVTATRLMCARHGFSDDDEQVVSYLLGLLTDEDAEWLDEMSIADDHVALDQRVVENDLIDAYVRGAMTDDTRQQVELAYLSSPHRFRMVRCAEDLLRRHGPP